jgi:hypothetical protein
MRAATAGWITVMAAVAASAPAFAEKLENDIAVFSALDKVTATIKILEVPLNQTVEFGSLKVTPHVCFSRPTTEQPKTTTYVDVEEVQLDGQQKKIFSGWMFAESPGLNAVEHPVFDVWLTGCQKPKNAVAANTVVPGAKAKAAVAGDAATAVPTDAADPNAAAAVAADPNAPRRRAKR